MTEILVLQQTFTFCVNQQRKPTLYSVIKDHFTIVTSSVDPSQNPKIRKWNPKETKQIIHLQVVILLLSLNETSMVKQFSISAAL